MEKIQYYGTGKRKTSTARVFLMPGSGQVVVNQIEPQRVFPEPVRAGRGDAAAHLTENRDKFDVYVNVKGGGTVGQAGAVRLGIARALLEFDPELRQSLKKAGYLTRDPRIKERKKYGQPGARKRYQFSKR